MKNLFDKLKKIVYNGIMKMKKNKHQTVKLVCDEDTQRANLFEDHIKITENYSAKQGGASEAEDFNVYFNFSGFTNDKAIMLTSMIDLDDSNTFTIFDISDETFLDSTDADYYIILSAAANFVTCSSEFIQESLFEHTGRLAYLVPNPLTEKDITTPDYKKHDNPPQILWYGETKDIMSVRPFLTKNVHNIKVATTGSISNTKDRAETTLIMSEKRKLKEIELADIIYLPPTHNKQGEIRRYKKVEESLLSGKFVIAPNLDYDWECLSFDGSLESGLKFFKDHEDLNTYIKEKQNNVVSKRSFENTTEALKAALELTPEDAYQRDIEHVLNEEILLL